MTAALHVAVGVVINHQGQVLIARRPPYVHLGGLWEFPGGKLEPGEAVESALARELAEEIGIQVLACRPLIKLRHHYPERQVLLDVWRVDAFRGTPHGRENQPVAWVEPADLGRYPFPEGNLPIVAATRLPDRYAILDVPAGAADAELLPRLESLAANGVTLVQLRAKALDEAAFRRLARVLVRRAEGLSLRMLLNGPPGLAIELGAAGAHLSASRLMALSGRPLPPELWLGVSCHNPQELAQAERINADFAVLGPVQATSSHPHTPPLGWRRFAEWIDPARLPVYALGGLTAADLATAHRHGAQGIAGIRAFLS